MDRGRINHHDCPGLANGGPAAAATVQNFADIGFIQVLIPTCGLEEVRRREISAFA